MTSAVNPRILIYILRRDVRLSDNPVFHSASQILSRNREDSRRNSQADLRKREDSLAPENRRPSFTHLLPVYVFPANQIEVSGFLSSSDARSPYPEARSRVAGVWRTGPHRAKFITEGVWDLKEKLNGLNCGSGLEVRVGRVEEVVQHMLDWYAEESGAVEQKPEVAGVWMTGEEGTEEKREENQVKKIAESRGVDFKVWSDEKYYVDDRDLPFDDIHELPDVYTSYRKSLEPLRSQPRETLPTPTELPPLPPMIPPQQDPFAIPNSLEALHKAVLSPLEKDSSFGLPFPPSWPKGVQSAHPFSGGESAAQDRLIHLISSGAMSSYKQTRNGMVGVDFSTKLSAFLAQGHLSARQVHWAMVDFEEGRGPGKEVHNYGKGENEGTYHVRFELLWRDYFRLYVRRYGSKVFDVHGIRDQMTQSSKNNRNDVRNKDQQRPARKHWRYLDKSGGAGDSAEKTLDAFTRFRSGRTGIGLIDASNRELFLTGYTSNRARQNVASFLASHVGIDWRVGAEWYEFLLIDYDLGSNWGNWQYVAGVGNDPRQGRVFNPVKQALDYDGRGEYIKSWVPELRDVKLTRSRGSNKEELDKQRLLGLYQAWKLNEWEKEELGLRGKEWVDDPLVRIQFSIGRGKGGEGDGRGRGRGQGGGGRGKNGRGFRRTGAQEKAERAEKSGCW